MSPDSHPRTKPESRRGLRRLLGGAAAAVVLGACDIPTEPPMVESRWIVPAEETSFGVSELLPGDVSLAVDSSAFIVDFDPVTFSETLGGLCGVACTVADGMTVPKPPFIATFSGEVSFPPEVSSMEVIDGQVRLEVYNGLNFDPIRPAAGAFGSLELTITDEGDDEVIGSSTIEGTATPFDPGATLIRLIDLVAATVEGPIGVRVTVTSPAGDPVTIDSSLELSVTPTPMDIRVASVTIDVANQAVNLDPVSLDLENVDDELTDRIVSGALLLDVVNPFGVAADFQVTVSGPTISTIQKSASIGTDTESQVVIDFTPDEIRSFLGEPDVVLSGGAVVDPGAGPVTVEPGERLILTAALDLTLLLGG